MIPNQMSHNSELTIRYLNQSRELYGNKIFLDSQIINVPVPNTKTLESFNKSIRECLKCELGNTRTNFVFGVGNPHAKIVFVGEAPGEKEDLKGEPFVGRAGQLLDKILAAIDLTRETFIFVMLLNADRPKIVIHFQVRWNYASLT